MGALDNTLKIEDEKNLYIKNTINLKSKILKRTDYTKFKNEEFLYLVSSFKVNNKKGLMKNIGS